MTRNDPPISKTVNPAGAPTIRITKPQPAQPAQPYTRETFMGDLKKVATKREAKK